MFFFVDLALDIARILLKQLLLSLSFNRYIHFFELSFFKKYRYIKGVLFYLALFKTLITFELFDLK